MWALIASWAMRNKGALAKGTAAVAVVGSLAAVVAVQTIRVQAAEADAAEARAETRELQVALKEAQVEAAARALAADELARAEYEQRGEDNSDAVGRVLVRARSICLPHDAGAQAPGDPELPGTAGLADGTSDGDEDSRDRAFAEAVVEDLEACSRELNRMQALQTWVRRNVAQEASDEQ